jgi:cytochrome c-type biogenesis protein CcmF
VLIGSTALIVSRQRELRADRRVESLASREAVFLVNNLLLVGLCLLTFWGTFFPLISEAITGERSSLGAPWFDRYVTPLALGLVLFTGIGPLLAWRRVSAGRAVGLFGPPVAFAVVVTLVLALLTSAAEEPLALLMFGFAAFALAGLAGEFARGASAQRALGGGSWPAALGRLISRNRRRYGGYIVHTGVAIAFVAVAASSSFQTSRDVRMVPGETTQVDDYTITYERAFTTVDEQEDRLTFGAVLAVERAGERSVLTPSRNYYSGRSAGTLASFFEGEASRSGGAAEDLWTAMRPDLTPVDGFIAGADRRIDRLTLPDEGEISNPPTPEDLELMQQAAETRAHFQGLAVQNLRTRYEQGDLPVDVRINVNPLVIWIWVGGATGIAGGLLAAWPTAAARRRRVSDVHAARLARDLGRA